MKPPRDGQDRPPSDDPPSGLSDWTDGAADWIARADRIARISRPATEVLLERLDPRPGQRILDVACGAGDPALSIAERVAPGGSVLATDGVAAMADAARERAAARGVTNLDVAVLSAEALDLPPRSFDGACCRFGAMFFDDAAATFAAMARAVRPGGNLVALTWSRDARNPYFTVAKEALDAAGAPAVEPARTVFELDDPDDALDACVRAGWAGPRVEAVGFPWRLPDTTPETLLDVQRELSRKLGRRMEGLAPERVERARRLVAERVADLDGMRRDGDALVLPAECLALTGRAP